MATKRPTVRLDSAGIARLLKSGEFAAATERAAEAIAENIRDQHPSVGAFKGGHGQIDLPVTVRMVTTDRAHAIVALAHPAGLAEQAKYGWLTKGAAQAGLDVKGGGE